MDCVHICNLIKAYACFPVTTEQQEDILVPCFLSGDAAAWVTRRTALAEKQIPQFYQGSTLVLAIIHNMQPKKPLLTSKD